MWFKLATLYFAASNSVYVHVPTMTLRALQNGIRCEIGPNQFASTVLLSIGFICSVICP